MSRGVILYGPPASGKDTVTRELAEIDNRYEHFHRLKAGAGRTSGYRVVEASDLVELRQRGEVLYDNERYGATYVIDRPGLDAIAERGNTPVVHLGQVAGVDALLKAYPLAWVVVGLWCPRDEVARRLSCRKDNRPGERLTAWDATLADIHSADPALFTLMLNTATMTPQKAARIIDSCCR